MSEGPSTEVKYPVVEKVKGFCQVMNTVCISATPPEPDAFLFSSLFHSLLQTMGTDEYLFQHNIT